MTSSSVYPTILRAHLFQTFTLKNKEHCEWLSKAIIPTTSRETYRPWVSTPKIGAFALSISLEYSLSWARRAVISCPIPTTPMTLPCSLRLVVAFNNTSMRAPALVIKGNSKLAVLEREARNIVSAEEKRRKYDQCVEWLTQHHRVLCQGQLALMLDNLSWWTPSQANNPSLWQIHVFFG